MASPFMFSEKQLSSLPGSTREARLGTQATKYTDKDVGKCLKLAAADSYVICADGDEIEGFMLSLEDATEGGYSFGSVQLNKREKVVRVAAGSAAATVGAWIVSAVQNAVGTANPSNLPLVKVTGTAPSRFRWRVISLQGGNGSAGTNVLIECV